MFIYLQDFHKIIREILPGSHNRAGLQFECAANAVRKLVHTKPILGQENHRKHRWRLRITLNDAFRLLNFKFVAATVCRSSANYTT